MGTYTVGQFPEIRVHFQLSFKCDFIYGGSQHATISIVKLGTLNK